MNIDDYKKDNKSFIKQFHNGIIRILILWIISREKIHGYGITMKLNSLFKIFDNEDYYFNPAKIYPILKKMEEKGLVESEEGLNNNKKVKFYTLTTKGVEFLDFIKSKWIKLLHNNQWKEFFEDMGNVNY